MKHAVLTSIAHNLADSLASGIGLMIGVYRMDVFGEAARSPEGYIEIDFLTGAISGARPSRSLARAVRLYRDALPDLCVRHGARLSDFRRLVVLYRGEGLTAQFNVEVTDRRGRTSQDFYVGVPGARPLYRDVYGRVRRLRSA